MLTGPSGAGKTSLLKLIYLAQKPSHGRVEIFGRPAAMVHPRDRPDLRRRMGVVFQDFRLLEHLSVFDNAALPLRMAGGRPSAYRYDVAELLSWVGLAGRMGALPAELSGGEKQRLAIARSVVARPDLLIADEPTGNVDPAMSFRLLRLFVELNRVGATVLLATHDEALVRESGAPVLRLEDGRMTTEAAA
ncbi:MAG: cell division ATP-binding protein FtsE [Caulobacteraceae bacterium]|nr:cell division ATP-binding protein FtsE [Caulobacteraceae bacterium]